MGGVDLNRYGMRSRLAARRKGQASTARDRIEAQYAPSARELFPALRLRLLSSRPIVGDMPPVRGADGITTPLRPIYGKPTFRNVIEDGELR